MSVFIPNLLIALREGVEASLIVGIIVAYLVKVNRRDVLPKLWIGVVLAAVIPMGLGVYWTWGPSTITFQAQEILGGALSLVAVCFVTWMIFWMGKNSRKMTAELKEKAEKNLEAGNPMALVWMAVFAVCREGAETAIFVWATVKSSADTGMMWPALGVVCGLILAVVVGWLIYKGSVSINLKMFFNVTGYLLIFVAAGIVLYGIGDLQEASAIPGWGILVYDYSANIASVAGTWWFVLLNAFFNIKYWFYPTHLQLVCWLAYLIIVLILFTLQIKGIIFTDKTNYKKKPESEKSAEQEKPAAPEDSAEQEKPAESEKSVEQVEQGTA